jgi:hypothetical protein
VAEHVVAHLLDRKVLDHVRHWDGFNAMVEAVATGSVRLRVPQDIAQHTHSESDPNDPEP